MGALVGTTTGRAIGNYRFVLPTDRGFSYQLTVNCSYQLTVDKYPNPQGYPRQALDMEKERLRTSAPYQVPVLSYQLTVAPYQVPADTALISLRNRR